MANYDNEAARQGLYNEVESSDSPLRHYTEDRRREVYAILNDLRMDAKLKEPHPLIEQHKTEMDLYQHQYGYSTENWSEIRTSQPIIDTSSVSIGSFQRMYLFLNPLFRAIESISGRIYVKYHHESFFIVEGEMVRFRFRELYYREFRTNFLKPSGRLAFIISSDKTNLLIRRQYIETETRKLPDMIQRVLFEIIKLAFEIKESKASNEYPHIKQESESQVDKLMRARHKEEISNVRILIQEAQQYEKANIIRSYISAVEENILENDGSQHDDITNWISWAKEKADWLDPLINREDDILRSTDKDKL